MWGWTLGPWGTGWGVHPGTRLPGATQHISHHTQPEVKGSTLIPLDSQLNKAVVKALKRLAMCYPVGGKKNKKLSYLEIRASGPVLTIFFSGQLNISKFLKHFIL